MSEPVVGEGARGARDPSVNDLFFVVSLACVASLLFQGFQSMCGDIAHKPVMSLRCETARCMAVKRAAVFVCLPVGSVRTSCQSPDLPVAT